MCSLPPEQLNDAGRRPFTDTFATARASDRSSVNVRSDASVTAVIVAVPGEPVDRHLVFQIEFVARHAIPEVAVVRADTDR